jgi:DNA-binding LacI/PurR family transcriptional regulator
MAIPTQAPTLEMVAARAGVSRATVSRVVNSSPKVTAEVIALVNTAIAELNYVPNRAARSLASRKTQVIALVVPESTAKVFADPFFASVVQGVAMYLADTDYTLNLLMASEMKPDKTRRYLLGGNVDGALVVSHHSGDHSYTHLGQKLPIVFGGRPVSGDPTLGHYVDVDNVSGGRRAARH